MLTFGLNDKFVKQNESFFDETINFLFLCAYNNIVSQSGLARTLRNEQRTRNQSSNQKQQVVNQSQPNAHDAP